MDFPSQSHGYGRWIPEREQCSTIIGILFKPSGRRRISLAFTLLKQPLLYYPEEEHRFQDNFPGGSLPRRTIGPGNERRQGSQLSNTGFFRLSILFQPENSPAIRSEDG